MVNRDGLTSATPEAPMPVELEEGKPLLGGEVLSGVAEVQSAAPGGCGGGHDLETLGTLSGAAPAAGHPLYYLYGLAALVLSLEAKVDPPS
jgi:hypothetical protein